MHSLPTGSVMDRLSRLERRADALAEMGNKAEVRRMCSSPKSECGQGSAVGGAALMEQRGTGAVLTRIVVRAMRSWHWRCFPVR